MSTRNSLVRRAGKTAVAVLATGLAGTTSPVHAGLAMAGRTAVDDQPTAYATHAPDQRPAVAPAPAADELPWGEPGGPAALAWPDLSDPTSYVSPTDAGPTPDEGRAARPATGTANPTPVPLPPAGYLAVVGMVVAWRAKRWVTRR
ncbi:MAG TPA: hypothetical protein VF796_19920 [Humisphaera sp.]